MIPVDDTGVMMMVMLMILFNDDNEHIVRKFLHRFIHLLFSSCLLLLSLHEIMLKDSTEMNKEKQQIDGKYAALI